VGTGTTHVVKSITPGVWDFTARTFTTSSWTDPNTNAVRARAVATVDNLVAAAIGFVTSDVERQATAVAAGACTEQVALPIAIEKDAIQDFLNAPDCRNITISQLFQAPGDNSCFTSLSTAPASKTSEMDHIPTGCHGTGNNNGGGEIATVSISDSISLQNGVVDQVLATIQGCLDANPPIRIRGSRHTANSCGNQTQPRTLRPHHHTACPKPEATGSWQRVYVSGVCKEELSGIEPGMAPPPARTPSRS
jgi:hypothetical protein